MCEAVLLQPYDRTCCVLEADWAALMPLLGGGSKWMCVLCCIGRLHTTSQRFQGFSGQTDL